MADIFCDQYAENGAAGNVAPAAAERAAAGRAVENRTSKLSDEKLFNLCKMFGARALEARRKFLGLLPEVNKRRLYERRGFLSIFEFAKKLAGASEEQVRNVLNLERKFEDKPLLQALLIDGDVSVNKLVRVASIATKENQEELAGQVKILPKSALETLVRDEKMARKNGVNLARQNGEYLNVGNAENQNLNGLQKPLFDDSELPGQPENLVHMKPEKADEKSQIQPIKSNINQDLKLLGALSAELKSKLNELKEKGIDINSLLLECLQKREAEIAEEKEKLAAKELEKVTTATQNEKVATNFNESKKAATHFTPFVNLKTSKQENLITRHIPPKPASRHIPNKIKSLLQKEHGTKCSIPNCAHEATTIHHTNRFAIARSHDPHFLAPLCREHHVLAHATDLQFWKKMKR